VVSDCRTPASTTWLGFTVSTVTSLGRNLKPSFTFGILRNRVTSPSSRTGTRQKRKRASRDRFARLAIESLTPQLFLL